MAYKRNLSFPLAPTFGEDKPKKKRTTSYGTGSKTVKRKSGATKKIAISEGGRKKTVTKTSKKGATTSRTKTISPDYKSATYTKKKDGKVVKNVTSKPFSPESKRTAQQLELSGQPKGYRSVAVRQNKKLDKFTANPTEVKAKKKAEKWVKRELKRDERAEKKADRQSDRYAKKRRRSAKKLKRQGHRKFQQQSRKNNRVERCKGTQKGSKKCASARKRNL